MKKYEKKFKEEKFQESRAIKIPMVGMTGEDYNGEIGVVLVVDKLKNLNRWDSYGVLSDILEGEYAAEGLTGNSLGVVVAINKEIIPYAYEDSGFQCYYNEGNRAIEYNRVKLYYK